ncbi:MAG: hypothetical protein LBU88_08595 [Treponema sp.]|jgi:hypothetical protein|nr:hypothetical protein [Treponema sp.]
MRNIILFVFIFLPISVFGLNIKVAPILYVDETENNARNTARVQNDLLNTLWAVETGIVIRFERLVNNNINSPQSLTEAVTICRNERIEYLIYGYITKRQHNFHAEIRLFEYESRTVLQSFYSMDSIEHYDRLLEDIARKIFIFIEETFNYDIITEKTSLTRLLIPAMVGYWTPVDSEWVKVFLGTVSAGSGVIFVPKDNLFTLFGLSFYVSTGLELKYRLGVGNPAGYEAFNHNLLITVPVRLYTTLAEKHQVFIGIGYNYFLDFFVIANKYSDSAVYVFNSMGMCLGLGYKYTINDKISIFARNDFDFLFNEQRDLVTFSILIGIEIKIYEEETRSRW